MSLVRIARALVLFALGSLFAAAYAEEPCPPLRPLASILNEVENSPRLAALPPGHSERLALYRELVCAADHAGIVPLQAEARVLLATELKVVNGSSARTVAFEAILYAENAETPKRLLGQALALLADLSEPDARPALLRRAREAFIADPARTIGQKTADITLTLDALRDAMNSGDDPGATIAASRLRAYAGDPTMPIACMAVHAIRGMGGVTSAERAVRIGLAAESNPRCDPIVSNDGRSASTAIGLAAQAMRANAAGDANALGALLRDPSAVYTFSVFANDLGLMRVFLLMAQTEALAKPELTPAARRNGLTEAALGAMATIDVEGRRTASAATRGDVLVEAAINMVYEMTH